MSNSNENALKPVEQGSTLELSPEQRVKIQALKASININDANGVLNFGTDVQKQVSDFTDGVLNHVRNKDSGHVGELLTSLMMQVKSINVSQLTYKKPGFFGKLFGGLIDRARQMMSHYEKVSSQIDDLQGRLGQVREELGKDIILMQGLFDRNVEFFRELELIIAAGEEKLNELRTVDFPQLQAAAAAGGTIEQQRISDFQQNLVRFERKLHDLKLSRTLTMQALPQIRILQHNNEQLTEKIQTSIVNTIPLWKNQIVIAVSLYRQKAALDVQNKVADTTNELIHRNSELLKSNSIEIAKASERGIVDIETLRKSQADLIHTIEQTILIQNEARTKRQSVEQELLKMETELKAKLTK